MKGNSHLHVQKVENEQFTIVLSKQAIESENSVTLQIRRGHSFVLADGHCY